MSVGLFMLQVQTLNLQSRRLINEHALGQEKYTLIEKYENSCLVSLLMKGPSKHSLTQIKDAVRYGLRAVKPQKTVGAFKVAVSDALVKHNPNVKGKVQLGVQAFADALVVMFKVYVRRSRCIGQLQCQEAASPVDKASNYPGLKKHRCRKSLRLVVRQPVYGELTK